jgi:hypothetical protein
MTGVQAKTRVQRALILKEDTARERLCPYGLQGGVYGRCSCRHAPAAAERSLQPA